MSGSGRRLGSQSGTHCILSKEDWIRQHEVSSAGSATVMSLINKYPFFLIKLNYILISLFFFFFLQENHIKIKEQ